MKNLLIAVALAVAATSAFADGEVNYPADIAQVPADGPQYQVAQTGSDGTWQANVDLQAQSVKADPQVQEPTDLYRGN